MKTQWLILAVAVVLSVCAFWPESTAADKPDRVDAQAAIKQLRAEVDLLKRQVKGLQDQDDKGGGAIAKLQAQVKALEDQDNKGGGAIAKLQAELDRQNKRFIALALDFEALQKWSVNLNEWLLVHVK